MKKLALFLLTAVAAFSANVQIRDLATTVVLPASNTYLIVDGATQNTAKTLMANFGFKTSTRVTLAGLSVTGLSTGVMVQTLGGAAIADGSASLYYYNSASVATPNGTTIIQPTVGSGRWLIISSSVLPTPTPSTLGGVFSKATILHTFLTGIGTDGTPASAIPDITDITGVGSMATQNASAVAIQGGTVGGLTTLGAGILNPTTLVGFTNNTGGLPTPYSTTQVVLHIGNTNAAAPAILIDGSGAGGLLEFRRASGTLASPTAVTNTSPLGTIGWRGYGTSFTNRRAEISGVATETWTNTAQGTSLDFKVTATGGTTTATAMTLTSTGINATSIGFTTPGPSVFTTSNWSSNANRRTTKQNLNLTTVNVKDFGAVGDGTTNDAAAITAAITAMTNYSTLYFPPGKYRFTSALVGFSSLSNITVTGDGAEIYNDTGAAGLNTFTFASSCSNVQVYNLRFTGTSSVRGNGIHIRMYCSNSSITNCYFQGCSDFAIHLSNEGATWSANFVVANNIINGPLGDGIHVGNAVNVSITGNTISNTGDDAIGIIADNVTYPPNRVTVTGNTITSAGSRGIAIAECVDVLVSGNTIVTCPQSGVEVFRYQSTTAYNNRIHVIGNTLINTNTIVGPRASIWMQFTNDCSVENNIIQDPVHGSGITFLDCNDLKIQGNTIRQAQSRGIAADDSTTANVAATWTGLVIKDNDLVWVVANEAIYAVPAAGKTITNLVVEGNVGRAVLGNWIYYDRITTGRVFNNTNTAGAVVAAGGSVSGVTFGNNN